MRPESWVDGTNAVAMFHDLPAEVSDRRLILYGCACARAAGDRLNETFREMIPQIESAIEEWQPGHDLVDVIAGLIPGGTFTAMMTELAFRTVRRTRSRDFVQNAVQQLRILFDDPDPIHSDLLRCIFGNPFEANEFDPAWRTANAVGIAKAIRDDSDFATLPILADALEDAGCHDEELLHHCRTATRHARGCRAVELVLGRDD